MFWNVIQREPDIDGGLSVAEYENNNWKEFKIK